MIQKTKFIFIMTIFGAIFSNNILAKSFHDLICVDNLKLQQARSRELQQLVIADQLDRKENASTLIDKNWDKINKRDLARRKRVGEIFGEGCFKSSKDYLAAAFIYQHGDIPDHYYQTYIWAKRAAELGDENGKGMAALAIDRYLISIGKKQLFGSQFYIEKLKPNEECFCREAVEPSFPDSLRVAYSGITLKKRYDRDVEFLGLKHCPEKCSATLKPTLKGDVPGLW